MQAISWRFRDGSVHRLYTTPEPDACSAPDCTPDNLIPVGRMVCSSFWACLSEDLDRRWLLSYETGGDLGAPRWTRKLPESELRVGAPLVLFGQS